MVSILGLWQLNGLSKWLLVAANALYITGVQLPTFVINVPLNNQLQTIRTLEASEDVIEGARAAFEERWNWANRLRTFAAIAVLAILLYGLHTFRA